ncbi:QsdR family transcriptional regulator [Actinomadura decatromicini]|uniref:TetR/AcrR family transcriptional regulator n=1 Tax=Actinomadura decatromicini TaxID=2604572 RepID=A0A5D3FYV1_9ACTN|nr:QsdR family transcriptional regulator [Actinomadura decatromicini]TYK53212.1 TetR/AcrR family transcriptional regulator [Actinomadura decatromicini]
MEQTPLQRQLAGRKGRPTALDAFRRARADFLAGRRLDVQSLAAELGVSRVTLYRWVGTREQLLVEVIWSLTERTLRDEWERLASEPGPRVPELMVRLLRAIWDQPGARRFLEQENDLAMRLLTLKSHGFQPRLLDLIREKVAEDLADGRVSTPLPLDDLAYTVLRVTESFHYLPTITGEPADPDAAGRVLAALLPPPRP